MANSLRWKSFGSSVTILFLLVIILPVLLVFLSLYLVSGGLGLILGGLSQAVFFLFVRYIYVFRIGYLHVWFVKKFQKTPHSRSGRTDVTAASGNSVSIHSIPCLADNYAYLLVNRGRPHEIQLGSLPATLPISVPHSNDLQKPSDLRLSGSSLLIPRLSESKLPEPKASELSPKDASSNFLFNSGPFIPIPPLRAVVVDAGDAEAILDAVASISALHYGGRQIEIEAILTTHHHWDHQGGNRGLVKSIPGLRVYGGWRDRVDCRTHSVEHGNIISVGEGVEVEVIETPGHTHGSLMYKMKCAGGFDCLLTGDTLFLGGCGAPFEQSRSMMSNNFWQVERHCHPSSLIFPGHEYTRAMLSSVLNSGDCPSSPSDYFALCSALYRAIHLRDLSTPAPTVPYRLNEEMKYNPNFRTYRRVAVLLRKACRRTLRSRPCASSQQPPYLDQHTPSDALVADSPSNRHFTESPTVQRPMDGGDNNEDDGEDDDDSLDGVSGSSGSEDELGSEGGNPPSESLLCKTIELPDVSSLRLVGRSVSRRSTESITGASSDHPFYEPLIDSSYSIEQSPRHSPWPRSLSGNTGALGFAAISSSAQSTSFAVFQPDPMTGSIQESCQLSRSRNNSSFSLKPDVPGSDFLRSTPVESDPPKLGYFSYSDGSQNAVTADFQEPSAISGGSVSVQGPLLDGSAASSFAKESNSAAPQLGSHSGRPIGQNKKSSRRKERVVDSPWITAPVSCGSPFLVIWKQELLELESILQLSEPEIGARLALERVREFLDERYLENARFSESIQPPSYANIVVTRDQLQSNDSETNTSFQMSSESQTLSIPYPPSNSPPSEPHEQSLTPSILITQLNSSDLEAAVDNHNVEILPSDTTQIDTALDKHDSAVDIQNPPLSDPVSPVAFSSESFTMAVPPDQPSPRKCSSRSRPHHEVDRGNGPSMSDLVSSLQLLVPPDQLGRNPGSAATRKSSSGIKNRVDGHIDPLWRSSSSPSILRDDFVTLLVSVGRSPISASTANKYWTRLTRKYIQSFPELFSSGENFTDSAPALPLNFIASELTASIQPPCSRKSSCYPSAPDKRTEPKKPKTSVDVPSPLAPEENKSASRKRHSRMSNYVEGVKPVKVVVDGHDFTKCRICQARPVMAVRSK